MMLNTIPPGSRGSLAASRAAVAGRDLAILPRVPGEIVYIPPGSRGSLAKSRAAVAGQDAAKLPRQPGGIVFIIMELKLDSNR